MMTHLLFNNKQHKLKCICYDKFMNKGNGFKQMNNELMTQFQYLVI